MKVYSNGKQVVATADRGEAERAYWSIACGQQQTTVSNPLSEGRGVTMVGHSSIAAYETNQEAIRGRRAEQPGTT